MYQNYLFGFSILSPKKGVFNLDSFEVNSVRIKRIVPRIKLQAFFLQSCIFDLRCSIFRIFVSMKKTAKSPSNKKEVKQKAIVMPILPKWAYWFVGGLACILYMGTISHGFALDDIAVIEQNAFVQKGFGDIPDILSTFYWEGYTDANAGLFRPISLIMFAVEHALSPDSAALHHFVNVLFYVLSAVLLLRVLQRCLPKVNPWFFFFVTLFFVVHPIHTEVVANIKSRDEIMAFFFFLVCCHFFYRNAERTLVDIALAALFFFFALLSKEGALVLLPILILLELRNNYTWKSHLKSFAPFVVIAVVWFAWHQSVVGQTELAGYTYHDNALLASASIGEQKATALSIFFRYEVKAFYPYVMSYDYSFPYFQIVGWGAPLAWLGLLSLLGGLFGIYYFFKKNVLLSLGLALLLFPLLLTSNLLFTVGTTMADRFLYVSVLGAAILLVLLLGLVKKTVADSQYAPTKIAVLLAPILLIFCVQTTMRNSVWASNQTLFTEDYKTAPESARVQYNYGNLLQLMAEDDPSRDEFQQAKGVYKKALQLDPGYTEASINLGRLFLVEKSYKKASKTFDNALEFAKESSDLWGGKGETYFYLNEKGRAAAAFDKALKFGNTLPGIYILRGTIAFEENKLEEAEKFFKTGVKLYPDNANLWLNLGNTAGSQKKYPEALKAFEEVRRIEPSNAQAIYYLGMTYKELGQLDKAQAMIDQYNRMVGTNN